MKSSGCNCKPAKASVELTIDRSLIENLPEVGWRDRRKLPTQGGIYFIQVNFGIAYIGQTGNLRKRWKSHERLAEIEALYQGACIRYLVVEDPEERSRAEAALNKQFNPPWEGRVWRQVEEVRLGKSSKWECFGYSIEIFKKGARFAYKFLAPYSRGDISLSFHSFSTHKEALEEAKKHIKLDYTFMSIDRWLMETQKAKLIAIEQYDELQKILPPISPTDQKSPLKPFFIEKNEWES
jgi:predicted GIY-YIG superfamily endonuclease